MRACLHQQSGRLLGTYGGAQEFRDQALVPGVGGVAEQALWGYGGRQSAR